MMKKYGCSDHGCVYGGPKGMGTNGGCNCLEGLRPREGAKVRATLRDYRKLCSDLQTENTRLVNLEINVPLDKEELCAKVLSLTAKIKKLKVSDKQLVTMYRSKTKETLSLLKKLKQLQYRFDEADKDRTRMTSIIQREANVHFRHITSESQNEKTLDRIEKIWGAAIGSDDGFELGILASMVSRFEEKAYPFEPPTDKERKEFMEEQSTPVEKN